jgi:hypothetical protein
MRKNVTFFLFLKADFVFSKKDFYKRLRDL